MRKLSFLPLYLEIFFSVVIVLSAGTLSAQSPTISSFTPASGPIGTAVTISGTNFSTTSANNIVWFGAVQATVNAATPSQLVVTVPAGATYKPVSVTVNGLMAFSVFPFNVRFPGSQIFDANSLATKVDFTTGLDPQDVASCDIDNDGKPDLIVINSNSNSVSVYRNTSPSGSFSVTSFAPKVDFTTGTTPLGMAIGDIDGDGKQDLVVANGGSISTVSVFRNAGISGSVTTASFDARVDLPTGSSSNDVAISDIDGDGKQDLIITNFNSNTISIYRNISTPGSVTAGSFEAKVDFSVDLNLQKITMGDVDGDGKPDILVPNWYSNTVSVYRNNSTSGSITGTSFETKVDFTTGLNPYSITLNDIDGDNKPDMIISNTNDNSISIYRNTSAPGIITTGSFAARIDFYSGSGPRGIDIGDIDGDGKPDIVVANYNNNTVSLFRNKSTSGSVTASSLESRIEFPTWTAPAIGIVGDIDCDGKPDIIVVNSNSNVISIFRNIIPPPVPPDIYSFSPSSGPIGTSVIIDGLNFSPVTSNNIVWFGAVQATVTSATSTQLTVVVPAGATYQPISVTVNGVTAWTRTSFAVTFPGIWSVDATAFASKVDFTSGASPSSSSAGDIDGDGMPDLVVVNGGSNTISVFRNISTSGSLSTASFDNKVDFPTGSTPSGVALGDIDGDGKLDIVVSNWGSSTISVFRNTSDSGTITSGSLASRVDFEVGSDPDDIAIGDIDGDGKPDIAVVNIISGTVSIFGNKSYPGSITAGSMTARVDLITGSSPSGVAIGDLDGDVKREIVVSNYGSNTVSIFKYINFPGLFSASSFGAIVDFTTGINPSDVAINDIDGDGKLDLAVLNYTDKTVSVLRNTSAFGIISAGSFESRVDFPTGLNPCSFAVSNINGDRKPDLAVLNNGDNSVSILCNTSTPGSITSGSFAAKTDITTGNNPRKITVGDLDGDGKQDLVVTNYNLNTVSVLQNTIPVPVPPVITSFSPVSGPIGTVVTITGTNFSTTPSNNKVWFGAVQATVTTATVTQLTVTVPIGATYQPITVTVSGFTAYSASPFNVTIPGTNIFDVTSLAPRVGFITGMSPSSVAIADIDGDGKPDLIITNTNVSSNRVTVYRNISTSGSVSPGSFAPGVDFYAGITPRGIAVGDIDGDGKPDLAVANLNGNTVSILRNTSIPGTINSSSFAEKVDLFTSSYPYGVSIGDIDGDGKPDLVVPDYMNNTVSVFRNNSEPGSITVASFEARVDFQVGNSPYQVAIGDIDGDGKPDLAITNWGSNSISLLRNISSAGSITLSSFATKVDFTAGTNPSQIAIADIDSDGKPDLIVTNSNSDSFSIFRNISTSGSLTLSSLALRSDFLLGPAMGSRALAVGDVDGDGKPDLVIGNTFPGSTKVYIFLNTSSTGMIGLSGKIEFTAGAGVSSIAIGDVDGDAKPDLVVTNFDGNSISILRNKLSDPLPLTITSFSPETGPIGTSVIITGTNFNTNPSNNIVWFGAVKATVTAASSTILTVTVPAGATYKPVSVTDITSGFTAYSGKPFNVTFTSTGILDASAFASKIDFATGTAPSGIAVGDIDNDGKPDLVVSNGTENTFSVYRNISTSGSVTTGSFAGKVDFSTGSMPAGLALGDLDGDGKPDLVVAIKGEGISIYRNTSATGIIDAGTFAAKVDFVTGYRPVEVVIVDIDGDRKPDIITSNSDDNSISVFINTGVSGSITSGSFATRIDFSTGSKPVGLAISDIDGDGKPDLIVANNGSGSVSIFRNISTPGSFDINSFAPRADLWIGNPWGLDVGDIDGDGKPDIVVANNAGASISVFRNNSTPGIISSFTFSSNVVFATLNNPDHVTIGDIDGDRKPDVAVTNFGSGMVSVFKNTSIFGSITSGSLSARADLQVGTNPAGIAICDIDGDNKPDIVAANNSGNSISVLRNVISETLLPPPTISLFTPASGIVGSAVTITGTGFSTTASDNIVWFGAVKAAVTAAAPTQLTVTVPVGATYKPITVTVNGLTAYSGKPFNVTFTDSGEIDETSLASKVDFASGVAPWSSVISDIDGDGKPDLIIANSNSNTVSVYRNISSSGSITSGSFATKVDFITGSNPSRVVISDIDGDGKPDLVVANHNSNSISVFRNISSPGSITDASFAAKVDFVTGSNPYYVAIGDIDGDGKPDLAVTNWADNTVSVLRNSSVSGSITSGSFAAKVDVLIGSYPSGVAIGDIDGDGKPDLVVNYVSGNSISILRNISTPGIITTGSLAPKVDLLVGAGPLDVALGDLDGDGKVDIVINSSNNNNISVYRNNSTLGSITPASFDTRVVLDAEYNPFCFTIGDVDGDGKPDLIVGSNSNNTVSIYRNLSSSGSINSGSFSSRIVFYTGGSSSSIALGDLNGDNKPDIIYTDSYNNIVSVLRNTISAPLPPPVITSFAPTSGQIGTNVIITGTGFSTTAANNIVWFGAVRAIVTSATSTSLTVSVQKGSTYQPISVTVGGLTAYSSKPFILTFPGPHTIGPNAFATRVDFATGTNPWGGSAIGDLDCDGKPDLVVTNFQGNSISVFRNTSTSGIIGESSFAPRVDFPTGQGAYGVAIADIDGDGKPDIVVTNSNSNTISIFRNQSYAGNLNLSSFYPKIDLPIGIGPWGVQISDIDGDGKPDLVVTNAGSNTLSIYRNRCTPGIISLNSFGQRVDFTTGSWPCNLAITDIDGDGKPDIAVTNMNSNNLSVFRNISIRGYITANSLAAKVDMAIGTSTSSPVSIGIAVVDIDGDNKPDIAVTNQDTKSISVFKNISTSGSITTGSFADKIDFAAGNGPQSIAATDIDGDGKPDLAVTNNGAGVISVLKNTSTSGSINAGSFSAKTDFSTHPDLFCVAIGDLDGDSQPDMVVVNYSSHTLSVLRNRIADVMAPVISSFTPISGPVGTVVTITGSNFNTTPAANAVSFGYVPATVTSATAIQLIVTVPAGAVTQPIIMTVNGLSVTSVNSFNVTSSSPDAPVINSFNPTSGPIGTTVTITGSNFNPTTANNNVRFGTIQATITSATTSQLIVTVPAGAVTQPISVTVNGQTATTSVPFTVTSSSPNAPVINSFSPTSGPVGTTVTITGMNFSTNLADNIVSFGGNQATVTAATVTQLTVKVPNGSGNMQISVTVNGMNATSNNPFNITFSGTGPNNNSFEFESPVLTLNGDGINDRLIIKNFEGYGKCSISVYNSRGVLIYSNKDYKNDWDLTINGRLLETGGYFYIAETDSGIYRGSFSILRPF